MRYLSKNYSVADFEYDCYLLAIIQLLNNKYFGLLNFYFHALIQQRQNSQSTIITNNWQYTNSRHRPKICKALIKEQQGYCAYSERYILPIHASEIEHFDDSKKKTSNDDYWNWYAVLRKMNQIKIGKKIKDYLPILDPQDPQLTQRICYKAGQFQTVQPGDTEAQNLINFLGWNDPTLARERDGFINRRKKDRARFFSNDPQGFIDYLKEEPDNLSFITALEAELGIRSLLLNNLPVRFWLLLLQIDCLVGILFLHKFLKL